MTARRPDPGNGRFVALSMKTGRVVWSHVVPAGHRVLADRRRQRRVLRRPGRDRVLADAPATATSTGPTTPAAPSRAARRCRTGSCTSATTRAAPTRSTPAPATRSGRSSTNGAHFGFGSGNFYSTPAVAFGRVYMGNTDGRVYSFAARTGQLAWATGTGAYVYASAAVADTPGSARRSTRLLRRQLLRVRRAIGRDPLAPPRRRQDLGLGRRSSATSSTTRTSARRRPPGLDVRTGQQVFSFPDGAFNPVIADHGAIYLVGYTTIYQMLPKRADAHRQHSARRQSRADARHARADKRAAHSRATRSHGTCVRALLLCLWSMRCRSGSHCQQPALQGPSVLRGARG